MVETKNLMGLNLNVDSELIANAVRETIIASVAAGLDKKEQIVQELVKSVMGERVLCDTGEKPRGYSSEKTCTLLEWNVRKALIGLTKEEIANMLEEQKPQLRELIRKEFAKKQTQSEFVKMFLDSLSSNLTSPYRSTVNVSFTRKENY